MSRTDPALPEGYRFGWEFEDVHDPYSLKTAVTLQKFITRHKGLFRKRIQHFWITVAVANCMDSEEKQKASLAQHAHLIEKARR